mmetsp:Transcript_5130/g.16270  ORF Transcript_5130/g.16270 Transcript_5130/m.16270 type:complete len:353 (-) Transcript_5130:16-1074(-)
MLSSRLPFPIPALADVPVNAAAQAVIAFRCRQFVLRQAAEIGVAACACICVRPALSAATQMLDAQRTTAINAAGEMRQKGIGTNVATAILAHQDDPPQVFGANVVEELTAGINPVPTVARMAVKSVLRFSVRQVTRVAVLVGADRVLQNVATAAPCERCAPMLSDRFAQSVAAVVGAVGKTVIPSALPDKWELRQGTASAVFYAGAASRADFAMRWTPRPLRTVVALVLAADTPALELLAADSRAPSMINDMRLRATPTDLMAWQAAIELVYGVGEAAAEVLVAPKKAKALLLHRDGIPRRLLRSATRVLLCGAAAYGVPCLFRACGQVPPENAAYWASCVALVFVRRSSTH